MASFVIVIATTYI